MVHDDVIVAAGCAARVHAGPQLYAARSSSLYVTGMMYNQRRIQDRSWRLRSLNTGV